MVDVPIFRRRHPMPAPHTADKRPDVESTLMRLEAVVDRLEGVYAHLRPQLPTQPEDPR